jgi:hypothetical protein
MSYPLSAPSDKLNRGRSRVGGIIKALKLVLSIYFEEVPFLIV